MIKRKSMTTIALSLAVSAFLIGCGGSDEATENTLTGYFVDAPVAGLQYRSSSGITGETDSYGRFRYRAGDEVMFTIGDLSLGEAKPETDGLVTPEILAQNNQELEVLLLRVLQSLDSDGDPSNGITISQEVVDSMKTLSETTSIAQFVNNESALLNLKNESAFTLALDEDYDGKIDVDPVTAQMHFSNTLTHWQQGYRPDANVSQGAGSMYGPGGGQGYGNGYGAGTGAGAGIPDLSTYPKADLTDAQKYALAYMWNEEKLAKDIYLALNELYPTQQFYNIATRSETRHEASVEEVVQRYDINITNLQDYTVNYSEEELRALPAGSYAIEGIQNLYDALYAKGSQSKTDALQVGCMVEVTDIDDLNRFIDTAREVNATDLVDVFTNLRAGSYNHYWAFDAALKASGVSEGCASAGEEYAKTPEEYPQHMH